jgi:hypothetical protein
VPIGQWNILRFGLAETKVLRIYLRVTIGRNIIDTSSHLSLAGKEGKGEGRR